MLQVTQSESGRELSGEFDFVLIGVLAQMKILVVKSDSTHEDICRLQQVGLF